MTLVKNAADEQQVKEARIYERFSREQDLDDLRNILSTEGGRRLIWKLLMKCRVFKLSHVNSGAETAFNEGHRAVGLPLLADCMDFDDLYLRMAKENKDREDK